MTDNPDNTGTPAGSPALGLAAAPYFLVNDVVKSGEYYRDRLGFDKLSFWGEPPCFCIATMGKASVMLSQIEGTNPPQIIPNNSQDGRSWDAYIWVSGVDAMYQHCRSNGTEIAREIQNADYSCREFDVLDPDGYRICFGEVMG